MATKFEKAFARMTPEQRKRATAEISGMMGMPPKKKAPQSTTSKKVSKSTTSKKAKK